ncbi:alcohol dehydrogenase [Leptospira wolffii]|uniref:alcohol dehydrogenase n=1 Tax=Leptospira wolffii TaxID=409998 RepID=UPI00108347C4|nr:alcohol dehydrogenase [Leptospira wolffii]TGK56109.1 alcohol dehydrogenase [Leptospira wolffii]TGK72155.1 alcohol dehydrogenase [Leptospira wolffii]TGK77459.1 alcohol dehydrogenase [Leptospira wolffii]TGL27732.1 alcohol dehydrogenase [Leptospira wolffii]
MISLRLAEFGSALSKEESPDPEPRGSEVLLEVLACGVCHSDLHLREGFYKIGSGEKLYVKDRGVRLPLTPGHEVVGRVKSFGPEAKGVSIGATRLVYPWIGCGVCEECESGLPHLCSSPRSLGIYRDGGYSDRILVPDPKWLLDTKGLEPEFACSYACAGLTAYGALKKALPLKSKDHLVVIGAGGLGLFAAQLLGLLTEAKAIFLDLEDSRLAKIRELGFVAVDSSKVNPSEEVRKISGPNGVASVIDFVNNSATSSLGFSLLKKNGRLILVGLFGGEIRIPAPIISLRNITVRGSYTGSPAELEELLALVSEKKPSPIPVRKRDLEEANPSLDDLAEGKGIGRTVLIPNRNGWKDS